MKLHPVFDNAKAVIFDKDGTLLDHDATWVEPTKEFGRLAAGGDIDLAKRLLKAQSFDWDTEEFMGGDGVAGNTWQETTRRFQIQLTAEGRSTEHLDAALRWITSVEAQATPLPGVADLLSLLKRRGLPIGLATNDVAANGRLHMEQLGLLDHFSAVVGSDSGYGGKPAPGMVEGCAGELGFSAKEVIMVGDTDRDTLAGSAAGCREVVAVLNGARLTASIETSASLVLEHTSDLIV